MLVGSQRFAGLQGAAGGTFCAKPLAMTKSKRPSNTTRQLDNRVLVAVTGGMVKADIVQRVTIGEPLNLRAIYEY